MADQPDVLPEAEAIDAVIRDSVTRLLELTAGETRAPLVVAVWLMKDGEALRQVASVRAGKEGKAPPRTGSVRLSFRKPFPPDRYRFKIDAVLDDYDRDPSVSGFHTTGFVRRAEDGSWAAEYKTWILKRFGAEWFAGW
jgi:hypothetical protein